MNQPLNTLPYESRFQHGNVVARSLSHLFYN